MIKRWLSDPSFKSWDWRATLPTFRPDALVFFRAKVTGRIGHMMVG